MSNKTAESMTPNVLTLETPGGNIEYLKEDVYIFPQGIIGYEIWKRYLLLPIPGVPDDSPYMMLQSIENKDLSFILMQIIVEDTDDDEEEPIIYHKHLKPLLDECKMTLNKTAVLLVISIESGFNGTQEISANLAGPILMDPETRVGRQVVLEEERYESKKVISVESVKKAK